MSKSYHNAKKFDDDYEDINFRGHTGWFSPAKSKKQIMAEARKARKLRSIAKINPDLIGEIIR